ncbi:MAG: hypothetical protein H8E46_05070 [FCB group bacterium]|nr:hypothetical protein [FCB group bacterium]
MKNTIIILFLLPVIAFSQPFDTGVRTDIENSWTADQTFVYVLADSMLIPLSGKILFGDGDSYIYEMSDDQIGFATAGGWRWYTNASGIVMSGGGALRLAGSATSPSYAARNSDINTGVGWAGADSLSLIAGGVEGVRIAEGAGNNSSMVSLYGDVEIDSSGNFTGNANIRGSDSFDALAIADTILNADFAAADMFYLQFTGAPGDSINTLFADCREDTLIVRRVTDGDANQAYNWLRIK